MDSGDQSGVEQWRNDAYRTKLSAVLRRYVMWSSSSGFALRSYIWLEGR